LMTDKKLRPALQPNVALEEGGPGQDAVIKVELETLPEVKEAKTDKLVLERLTVEPSEKEIDAAVARMAEGQKSFDPAPASRKAALGDRVLLDFEGKVDGDVFEGGKGEGMAIELGSGRLIPGFEEQLVGAKVNEQREVKVRFPDAYPVDRLKGRDAIFEVTVNEVQVARETKADDEFAKSMGLEGLDQLRGLLKTQVEQELNGLTRTHMKRQLLDALHERHDFEVPPSMVEAEFEQIWRQLEHEASHEDDPEAARREMEGDREDYRAIAERRVRLGLLLASIGEKEGVNVTPQEMQQLITQAAQQYRPEDRQRFLEMVQNDPMTAAQLRAPLFEDKVVDHLFAGAKISERAVTREELEASIESEEGHVHGPGCGHDHAAKSKPAKKVPVKQASAKKAAAKSVPKSASAPKAAKRSTPKRKKS